MSVSSENDLAKIINAYMQLFKGTRYDKPRNLCDVAQGLYDAMYQHYDNCYEMQWEEPQIRICELVSNEVLPKLDKAIVNVKHNGVANEIYELRKRFMAISARRNLKNFALYHEQYRTKKVWNKTMDTVECIFYYMDIFNTSHKLNLLRASLMPSMGKSFIANLAVAQMIGNNPNIHILRITYSDDLCVSTTRQTADIINSRAFREIFPRYEKYVGEKIFKSNTSYSLCIVDCEDQYNLNSVTRDGQSTGKRAQVLIIDDLLKDDTESYNKELHKRMVNRYDSTWTSRAEDDNLKVILLGTMWAPTDLLNVVYDRAIQNDRLIPSARYKYCEVTRSGNAVFIGVPALDEKDLSTCPKRYSTQSLREKRANMSRFLWMCVYQQDPIAPEGLEFDYSILKQYDELPEEIKNTTGRYATLDPARRGKNYVSMPIFYRNDGEKNQFYLVDFMYQKKSMKELYDKIVNKIIEHNINYFLIENNTDTSLRTVIEEKLKEAGYFNCTIEETYSTANKEQRIKDNQGAVRGNITYPRKGLHASNTDIAMAMESMTSYSFDYPNKFDDAIDSIVLFVMKYIEKTNSYNRVGSFNRKKLRL